MTPDGLLVLKYGREQVDTARKIAAECPIGYLIYVDRMSGSVFYQDVKSQDQINTNFTKEHIEIVWHGLQPHDPAHIDWDHLNSKASGGKFDVYKARGK